MDRVQELEAALEKERAYAATMANTVAELEIGRKAASFLVGVLEEIASGRVDPGDCALFATLALTKVSGETAQ